MSRLLWIESWVRAQQGGLSSAPTMSGASAGEFKGQGWILPGAESWQSPGGLSFSPCRTSPRVLLAESDWQGGLESRPWSFCVASGLCLEFPYCVLLPVLTPSSCRCWLIATFTGKSSMISLHQVVQWLSVPKVICLPCLSR